MYNDNTQLAIGEAIRYEIQYRDSENDTKIQPRSLRLTVANSEPGFKKVFYLLGPYSVYVQLVPANYHEVKNSNIEPEDPYLVQSCAAVGAGEVFEAVLPLNGNSRVSVDANGVVCYKWWLDILSQSIIGSPKTKVSVLIDRDDVNNGASASVSSSSSSSTAFSAPASFSSISSASSASLPGSTFSSAPLFVSKFPCNKLWNLPPAKQPCHLVILTHGVYSNAHCDLLYLHDKLAAKYPSLLIRGFNGNTGHTEKGIKWLGVNLANYIDDQLNGTHDIDRISFVGHSLGGVVQAFAIFFLLNNKDYVRPGRKLLKHIKPVNFITLASPMLGTQSEFSNLINVGLEVGSLGKTGKDLSLRNRYFSKFAMQSKKQNHLILRPILESFPQDLKFHFYLKQFSHRVSFANILNDGIVPLKTSALLYLDYRSLHVVKRLQNNDAIDDAGDGDDVGEVSEPESSAGDKVKQNIQDKKDTARGMKNAVLNQRPHDDYSKNDSPKSETSHKTKPLSSPVLGKPPILLKHPTSLKSAGIFNNSSKREAKIKRISTLPVSKEEEATYYKPPQSSSVISAIRVLMSPGPKELFFDGYKESTVVGEDSTIVHDRLYTYKELPPPHFNKQTWTTRQCNDSKVLSVSELKKLLKTDSEDLPFTYKSKKSNYLAKKHFKSKQLAEKIARLYLFDKPWRKILVNLEPDAHNNIIVRRRFVNSYGWSVVNYLVNIFDAEGEKEYSSGEIDAVGNVYYDARISPLAKRFVRMEKGDGGESYEDEKEEGLVEVEIGSEEEEKEGEAETTTEEEEAEEEAAYLRDQTSKTSFGNH